MDVTTLKDRIAKAQNKIAKKQGTIEKKQKWIASGKYDSFYVECFEDDIKRLNSEIAETLKSIEKYENQLSGEIERESMFIHEVPEELRGMQDELVARWDEWDKELKARRTAEYRELGWYEFLKKYSNADYQLVHTSDEDIHKSNERSAKAFIIDLYMRIRDTTGKVTSWDNIYCSGVALNGIVEGVEGRARIETITAGGYNIQRLHLRTLVHSI